MLSFLKRKDNDPKAALKEALGDQELPQFPRVAQQVIEHMRDPSASANSMTQLLMQDPGLSAKLLSMANVAAVGRGHEISDLTQAIPRLGMRAVESVVVAAAVAKISSAKPTQSYHPKAFWRASSMRANVAKKLAEMLQPSTATETYTSALLQEMAVPFLAKGRTREYDPLLEHWHNSDDPLHKLEQSTFGWDHAEVGGWLCKVWKLPERLTKIISGHHSAADVPTAVYLSGYLREGDERNGIDALVETAEREFNLNADRVRNAVEGGADEVDALASILSP